ncbi:ABC transporter substrate-binding protein [Persicirhabdus sediminis]|uniref:ABC transporter substrate-binding protein n=1 Tax=Persicirhabdus sediminis TaxID=454144 RepID=UPI001F335677|nr:ABC transporter substrate-binding protein [Persicirhabdus sediminis]
MSKLSLISLSLCLLWWLVANFNVVDKSTTLRINGPFEFTSQDLSKDGYLYTRLQVVETLCGVAPNGEITPMLATDWSESADGLRWTFQIRQNVHFHDGTIMTADHVQHALLEAMTKPGVLQTTPISKIYAEGNDRLVVQLEHKYSALPAVLAHYSAAITITDPNHHRENSFLIGTGPYRPTLIAPPHKIHLSKFDQYWSEPANIPHVQYLTGHRAESRSLQSQSGQADLAYTLDPASQQLLANSPHLNIHTGSIPRTVVIKLNNDHRFLNQPNTRMAISLAIDRTGIAEHITRTKGAEAYQLFPPALASWHLKHSPQTKRDLTKAKELMQQAGWKMGDDGLLKRDHARFEITLMTYADRPELTVIATAIQAQLLEIGIKVNIAIENSSSIPDGHHDGSLEMALIARNYGLIADPLALLEQDCASHHGSDWGHMNWSSSTLNRHLKLTNEANGDQQQRIHKQAIANIFASEMPVIPVVFYTQQVSINKRLQNFTFDPFELNYRISEIYFDDNND